MAARRRRCAFCATPLPSDASPRRKYCDEDCRRGRTKPKARELGPMEAATEAAIADAQAAGALTVRHAGAVEGVRVLARKIDTEDELRMATVLLLREGVLTKPPPIDNVSLPTFLKFCDALGLVPGGPVPEKKPEGSSGNKVLQLAARVPKPKRA